MSELQEKPHIKALFLVGQGEEAVPVVSWAPDGHPLVYVKGQPSLVRADKVPATVAGRIEYLHLVDSD